MAWECDIGLKMGFRAAVKVFSLIFLGLPFCIVWKMRAGIVVAIVSCYVVFPLLMRRGREGTERCRPGSVALGCVLVGED